jgi:purine-binding chemotaxis protein CheW
VHALRILPPHPALWPGLKNAEYKFGCGGPPLNPRAKRIASNWVQASAGELLSSLKLRPSWKEYPCRTSFCDLQTAPTGLAGWPDAGDKSGQSPIKAAGGVDVNDLYNEEPGKYVIFTIDDFMFGLPVNSIETAIRMVEITPIPGSPSFILGAINFHGKIIPVIDLRQRFEMTIRPIYVNDQMIIIHTAECFFALTIDAVKDVIECKTAMITKADDILPNLPYAVGIAKLFDGMILLNDPKKILYPDEIEKINDLMKTEQI